MRLRLALALPAFVLLSGCDLDDLMGVKKPLAGAKELAGAWACSSVAPGGAKFQSSLAFMDDGTATQVSTTHATRDGKAVELGWMERLNWKRTAAGLEFKTTYRVVTKYLMDGQKRDLGEANKLNALSMKDRPELLVATQNVIELSANQLTLGEPGGGKTSCQRKV
jgi:hypothetical protein